MNRSLDLRIEQTLRDMAVAAAREDRALNAARKRARHASEAELAALQRLELDTATRANRRFIALLQRVNVALDRDRPHRIAYYLRPILERCAETDKQARLERRYARAKTLLDEGLRSLDDKNPFKAFAQFSEWLSTVNIDYKPLMPTGDRVGNPCTNRVQVVAFDQGPFVMARPLLPFQLPWSRAIAIDQLLADGVWNR
jgi:hypothetical protein